MKKVVALFFVLAYFIFAANPSAAAIPGLSRQQLQPDFLYEEVLQEKAEELKAEEMQEEHIQDEPALVVIPDSPRPHLARSYASAPEIFPSRLTLPLKFPMDDLQALANRNLIRSFSGEVQYLDGAVSGRLQYTLRREEDAQVTEEDGRIKISFPVQFHVRFASAVQAMLVRVPLSAQTEGELNVFITLTPGVERDWSIRTGAEVDFEWITPPRFNVFMGIRVGVQTESERFLREAIRDNLHMIDTVVNREIGLRNAMQREWDNLTLPVRAADSVFLHFDPRGISAPPLNITSDGITFTAQVETPISLSIGLGDVIPARRRSLPTLEQYTGGEPVNLNVKTQLSYDSLEQEAMRALSGREIDMGTATVTVRTLNLMGSGKNLVAAFEISAGESSGTIYAIGEPYFHEDTRILSIKNFDLDTGTRDELSRSADWLLQPALVNFLNEKMEWQLGPRIDKLIEETRAIFASRNLSEEFELEGTFGSARFNGLRVTAQGIEIALTLEGAAGLTYTPLH